MADNIADTLAAIEIGLKTQAQRFLPHNVAHFNLQTHTLSRLIPLMAETLNDTHPLYQKLIQLDAAWCQLEMGLYGLCSDCETPINITLLQHNPLRQRCGACQQKYIPHPLKKL
ncbi:TraR/DksA C4-type zinc finger protein [Shewanella surugensis]|uniref:TraR/DksA C4-type zinc finger protein n=1 Tax=Shewanella surugensis TaxID=212020 RepID=A0ABT0LCE0_9GAMM|nr:TraR/DksA C4-type zinc finger protein [Shewanella surugensis]MCL1125374.1 TraR/DksA C4-type zinc finger protein [Shewanella surugensis]